MMIVLADKFPRYRKFIVALAGVLGQGVLLAQSLIGAGLIHGTVLTSVQAGLALLTALGVRVAANDDSSHDDPSESGFDVDEIGGTPLGNAIETGLEGIDHITHGGLTGLVKQSGDDGYPGVETDPHGMDPYHPSPHPRD